MLVSNVSHPRQIYSASSYDNQTSMPQDLNESFRHIYKSIFETSQGKITIFVCLVYGHIILHKVHIQRYGILDFISYKL